MPNVVTNQVIAQRLRRAAIANARPAIEWGCRRDAEGVVLPREDGIDEQDYLAAKAIVDAVMAEGERRFKTPLEFWVAFSALPAEAQAAVMRWKAIVELRELATGRPDVMDEVMHQAGTELLATAPAVYSAMAVAGQLDFDPTEVLAGG